VQQVGKCSGDGCELREFYCSRGDGTVKVYACLGGCSEGACPSAYSESSDAVDVSPVDDAGFTTR